MLKDMVGREFGEGDYVLFSTAHGLRVAKVRGIKPGRVAVQVLQVGGRRAMVGSKYSVDYVSGHFYKLNPTDVVDEGEDLTYSPE